MQISNTIDKGKTKARIHTPIRFQEYYPQSLAQKGDTVINPTIIINYKLLFVDNRVSAEFAVSITVWGYLKAYMLEPVDSSIRPTQLKQMGLE
jgi:hypothetical protein